MLHICKYVLDVDKGYVIHMLPLDEIIDYFLHTESTFRAELLVTLCFPALLGPLNLARHS